MLLTSASNYCVYDYGPPMLIKCYKHQWVDPEPFVMKSDNDIVGIFCNLCITEMFESHISNYALLSATKGVPPRDIIKEEELTSVMIKVTK